MATLSRSCRAGAPAASAASTTSSSGRGAARPASVMTMSRRSGCALGSGFGLSPGAVPSPMLLRRAGLAGRLALGLALPLLPGLAFAAFTPDLGDGGVVVHQVAVEDVAAVVAGHEVQVVHVGGVQHGVDGAGAGRADGPRREAG